MSEKLIKGQIVRAQSGFFTVETRHGQVTAKLRGRHMQGRQESDAAALGDHVLVEAFEDGSAVIEEIKERTRVLSRKAPGRESEQVLVANLDQAVFVMACADPDPNFRMLDRFLVVAEKENIPAVICANKLDLVMPRSAREEFGLYKKLGYGVVYTSAVSGRGVRKLRKILRHKLSVFAGPSGVGKSTLLNAIQPGLGLRTHHVREKTKKGYHTTVVPELFPLKKGGYVADTPGVKAFALWDIEPEELDAYFPEMRDLVAHCDFSDCTHMHEPGCAVLEALERGSITPERYDSYCRIRLGEEE
jgi:ribosome biogenesis GTPase